MNRFRNLVFIVIIIVLLVAAFISHPQESGSDVVIVQSTLTPTLLPDTPTALPETPLAYNNSQVVPTFSSQLSSIEDDPTPTSQAFFASEMQTPYAGEKETSSGDNGAVEDWNPPPLEVPIARHPGDHYWMIRPVGSDQNNFGLPNYPYGSNGTGDDLRIHHGIDIANPIGVDVYAAADGTVTWSGKGHYNEYEKITVYGNTIVIEHDFGLKGEKVYTLYAHLSGLLVRKGERVQSGQIIGLIGDTGQVTGPHVHFEVRVGRNSYFDVQNPSLWIAPYVGSGIIAGRVVMEDGDVVEDAPVILIERRTGQVVDRTTTYAGSGIKNDPYWGENFVLADVPAGEYLITSRFGSITWSAEVTVLPGMTNWADMLYKDSGEEETEEDEG